MSSKHEFVVHELQGLKQLSPVPVNDHYFQMRLNLLQMKIYKMVHDLEKKFLYHDNHLFHFD
ncbi:unnamed protein product [Schistosoma mattheei]|uniref:Uncharacterized protein n=1 Tax=Schistosoma mattheei TaxID=31246 RepID=A0A3P8JBU7_9TREM|nr:unnamed protein product [Schistosoma mattheei]